MRTNMFNLDAHAELAKAMPEVGKSYRMIGSNGDEMVTVTAIEGNPWPTVVAKTAAGIEVRVKLHNTKFKAT